LIPLQSAANQAAFTAERLVITADRHGRRARSSEPSRPSLEPSAEMARAITAAAIAVTPDGACRHARWRLPSRPMALAITPVSIAITSDGDRHHGRMHGVRDRMRSVRA
jgi:hypothetical protein